MNIKPKQPDIMPRYCGRSGDRLELFRQPTGYSTQTGVETFHYWFVCPNADKKDTPYTPFGYYQVRLVNCDGTAWAEEKSSYTYQPDYRDCTPWPTSSPLPITPRKRVRATRS